MTLEERIATLGPDRQNIIRFMRALGWTVERHKARKNTHWVFIRPDTGGLWDRVQASQGNLTWGWVQGVCQRHEPECAEMMRNAFREWRASQARLHAANEAASDD